MGIKQTAKDWKPMVRPALESKTKELLLMGYPQATSEDIWSCLENSLWKGDPQKRIHEVVQDIFHLSGNSYMSYLTLDSYQEDNDLMASIAALTGKGIG